MTLTGRSSASSATSEHVASKPMPTTASGRDTGVAARAARTALPTARQMSSDDCSTWSGVVCQSLNAFFGAADLTAVAP